ncbi:hypothetical protein BGW39_001708 [Mortierella sp. 14UC]|nr:hypothetical protein BGW39_001708 [Mortierella sp. 14UC]
MYISALPKEVLLLIGAFLDRDDIIAATSTCRALRSDLASFLWSQLVFPAPDGTIPVDANTVKAHAHFIHTLTYRTTISPNYTIDFPVLTDLHFDFPLWPSTFPSTVRPSDPDHYVASIIRLCPRIQNLTLTNVTHLPSYQLWEAVSATVKTPCRLSVTRMGSTDKESVQAFWRACTLFEDLELLNFDLLRSSELSHFSFPRLKRLTQQLIPFYGDSIGHAGHLTWMMRCPNLTFLDWRANSSRFPDSRLVEAIRQGAWPKLDSFQLTGVTYSDEDSATLLRYFPPLSSFRLSSCGLSELSFSQLQERHFSTLCILDMNGCTQFSSNMVLSVLSGCPLLEELSAHYVTVGDMRQLDPARRSWVCLGLKRLFVFVARDPNYLDSDKLFIEQLSKLKQLEVLDFGTGPLSDLDGTLAKDLRSRGVPQLRLDSGLTGLAGLKSIVVVAFHGAVQSLGIKEIQWMKENWPELQELSGILSERPDTCTILKEMLRENGIGSYED